MKKQINLLPQSEIKELRLELASSQLVKFFATILVTLVIFFVGGFCAKILIRAEISVTDGQISEYQNQLSSSNNQALEKEIISLNNQINNLNNLERQHYYWSKALVELGNLAPNDFHIDMFTGDRSTNQMSISGVADSRDSVLSFWANVKRSNLFKNIDFPLNNLEKPTNTPFTFSFMIDQNLITAK